MFNDIGIRNLYKIPNDYIDLIIMTKLELSSNQSFSQSLKEKLMRSGQKFLKCKFM